MKVMTRSLAALFAVLAAALAVGCTGSDDDDSGGSSSSGGTSSGGVAECGDAGRNADGGCLTGGTGGTDGGAGADAGADAGEPEFRVTAISVFFTDAPVAPEHAAEGTISVNYGDQKVADATVTLNGTPIPADATLGAGFYDVGASGMGNVTGGTELTLTATATINNQQKSASVTFLCPPEVAITAPAANSVTSSGQTLDVQWSGQLTSDSMFGPMLGFYACFIHATGDEVSMLGHGDWFINLTPGQTSASLPVESDCARYLLELRAAGETTMSPDRRGFGACYLQRRIGLLGPAR